MSLILSQRWYLTPDLRARKSHRRPRADVMFHARGPGEEFMGPLMGERLNCWASKEWHGGKVVTGAPSVRVAVSKPWQTLADGNHISRIRRRSFRDSQGDSAKEVTLPASTAGNFRGTEVVCDDHDPVAEQNFILHPRKKRRRDGEAVGRMKGVLKDKAASWKQKRRRAGISRRKNLGTQTIAGVSAQGRGLRAIIPGGTKSERKAGYHRFEHWYSSDLQLTVMNKRSDPRFGIPPTR